MGQHRPETLVIMERTAFTRAFDQGGLDRLAELARLGTPAHAENFDVAGVADRLAAVEVLITGWGCPPVDAAVLAAAPRLRAIIHTAGTVKGHVTSACWDADMAITTAAEANAIPVAEYTLAAILAAGKRVPAFVHTYRQHPGDLDSRASVVDAGNFGRRVGLVGLSRIGRRVASLLQPFDLEVLISDPYAAPEDATALGARLVDLETLLRSSQVVSLHAPELSSTYRMIGAAELTAMPDGATLINTARGGLVDTAALTAQCQAGRLSAILDVTDPEPLPADSPLYRLPNVVLTPHIAGAVDGETRRLGELALDELARYGAGLPFEHQVRRGSLSRIA